MGSLGGLWGPSLTWSNLQTNRPFKQKLKVVVVVVVVVITSGSINSGVGGGDKW